MIGSVDIGGTKIAVGLVDDDGQLLSKMESSTEADRGYPRALDRIASMLRQTARNARPAIPRIGTGSTRPPYPLSREFGHVPFFPPLPRPNPLPPLPPPFFFPRAADNT